ncbi:YciI family protein [Aquipuribacter nitratireducens]|uniref:YciI family protein n=1 Tax=Aquipuribacter nitratireducens TaxID=650104 RepID=A0ABW0GM77_9MICO
MAKYLVLIYEDETKYVDATPEEWQASMAEHEAFSAAVGEHGGTIVGGEALHPTSTATTIRGGELSDGPFLESKEALGGYYVIDARDLDHAIEIARLCPAGAGGVEVRPVMEFD